MAKKFKDIKEIAKQRHKDNPETAIAILQMIELKAIEEGDLEAAKLWRDWTFGPVTQKIESQNINRSVIIDATGINPKNIFNSEAIGGVEDIAA
jgi:hypothetical protein